MKIGLISFHNAANYGAALQAYALQKYLQKQGCSCEYINYVNDMRRNAYSMTFQICSSLKHGNIKGALAYTLGSPLMLLRKKRFGCFYKQHLKQTEKVYHSSEEAKELNNVYDIFIVGSDQVWSPHHNGHDTAFLLDFVDNDKKKISYASSFGVSSIDAQIEDRYRHCLKRFSYISVRETFGQQLVRQLSGEESTVVLDPVFLLRQSDWLQFVKQNKWSKRDYIFSYTNRPGQFDDFIKTTHYDISNKLHYKLGRNTSLGDFVNNKVRVKYAMSPTDFLEAIYYADLVVTASFHCVALSIILNKPFVAVLIGNAGKDERIVNLLKQLGLESRIFNPQMTNELVCAPIDYEEVNNRIDGLRELSVNFLKNAVNN